MANSLTEKMGKMHTHLFHRRENKWPKINKNISTYIKFKKN